MDIFTHRHNYTISDLSTIEGRLQTFENWPSAHPIKPLKLAEAGFLPTGNGDEVYCFKCNQGLRQFEPEDDPWTEHAKWFPSCEFVKEKFSMDLVESSEFGILVAVKSYSFVLVRSIINLFGIFWDHFQFADSSKALVRNPISTKEDSNSSDKTICTLCCDEERDILFLPCSHLITCKKCAFKLQTCPNCRVKITGFIHVYF